MWVLAVVVVGIDLGTKAWAFAAIPAGETRTLLPGILEATPRMNPGAAFSLLSGYEHGNLVFVIITALLIPVLGYLAERTYRDAPGWPFGLLIGGAAGNLVDRLAGTVVDGERVHAVRDFIALGWWPTFNIADAAIAVGVAAVLVWSIFFDEDSAGEEAAGGEPAQEGRA
jgi:signal peptidase II